MPGILKDIKKKPKGNFHIFTFHGSVKNVLKVSQKWTKNGFPYNDPNTPKNQVNDRHLAIKLV